MESAPAASANYHVRNSYAGSERSEDDDEPPQSNHHHQGAAFASLPAVNHARGPEPLWRRSVRSFFNSISGKTRSKLPMSASSHRADYRRIWPSAPGAEGELEGQMLTPSHANHDASFMGSMKAMLFSSWLSILLLFIPIGFLTSFFKANPILIFATNAIAIIPLSTLLTEATEKIAAESGDLIGALLNISLGNLVELILFVALVNNHIAIVEASILGSILVNLLLILGSALITCHARNFKLSQDTNGTQLLGCLLFVSVFAFFMPTAFDYAFKHIEGSHSITLKMSRFSAFVVLLLYFLYFVHEIRSPSDEPDCEANGQDAHPSMPRPSFHDPNYHSHPSRTVRFADQEPHQPSSNVLYTINSPIEMDAIVPPKIEVEGDPAPEDGEPRSRANSSASTHPPSAYQQVRARRSSRSMSLTSLRGYPDPSMPAGERPTSRQSAQSSFSTFHVMLENRRDLEYMAHGQIVPAKKSGSIAAPTMVLIITSGLMSMCAEFLVSTIDDVTHQGHLSESVIGLIILPIVGNIAEYVTVVAVAAKDKMDLAIAVSVGSGIQIALCVTPLTVLAGWILDRDLALTFNPFEMMTLFGSVLLVNLLILTGGQSASSSIGLKGALMCGCYAIISLGAYLAPTLEE